MAKVDYQGVPEQSPELQAPNDYQHVDAGPGAFGAAEAEGAGSVGQGLMQTADFYNKVAADDSTNNFLQERSKILYGDPSKGPMVDANGQPVLGPGGQPVNNGGFLGLRGADAMRAAPEVTQQLNDAMQSSREGLSTPIARLQYDSDSRRYMAQAMGDIGQHADQQQKVWASSTYDTQIALHQNELAQSPLDPTNITNSTNAMITALQNKAKIDGTDPAAATLTGHQLAAETQVKALLLTNPVQAKAAFDHANGVLASSPEYYSLGQEVRTRYNDAIMAPASDALINGAVSAATTAVQGSFVGGKPNPNSIGNVRSGPNSFAQPATPTDGVMLAANTLRSGYQGLTIAQIAQKWAPASDHNDPVAWARNVAGASGLGTDQVPNLNDPIQLAALVKGIGIAEHGEKGAAAFSPAIIQQGVTASLAGQHPNVAATGGGAYPSSTDALRANMATVVSNAQAQAEKLFPNDSAAQTQMVDRVERGLNLRISQQEQQYTVDTHTVQSVMASPNPPTSEEELVGTSPQVAAAWSSMQINNPYAALSVERMFDANSKGKSVTYGTQFKDYLDRALAPTTDPTRVTNPAQLWNFVGQGEDAPLTNTGVNALSDIMKARGTPQGEAFASQVRSVMDQAHQDIAYSDKSMGLNDPKGEALFSRFATQALPILEKANQSGNLAQVLNPKSPDYIGHLTQTFLRPPSEVMHDQLFDKSPTEALTTKYMTPDQLGVELLKQSVQAGHLSQEEAARISKDRGYKIANVPPHGTALPADSAPPAAHENPNPLGLFQ